MEAYPLHWPAGWPRTNPYQRESDRRFGGASRTGSRKLALGRAINQLVDELRLLGATNVIVSSNMLTKSDGLPYADDRNIEDPGIAVYFDFNKKPMVMARDKYTSVAGNIRALTLAIDGMRQMDRHGGRYMMERAFTGFIAIAPPDWKKPWREVFGVKADWTGDIGALYREKAKQRHSDVGGSDALMAELNVAYAEARSALGQ
jgi:hypothetical protein